MKNYRIEIFNTNTGKIEKSFEKLFVSQEAVHRYCQARTTRQEFVMYDEIYKEDVLGAIPEEKSI